MSSRGNGRSDILRIFFPERCVFCGSLLSPSQEFVCESCAEKLSFLHIRRELMAGPEKRKLICRAPFAYEGLVRDGILSFKFRGKEESFRGLSLLLAKELSKDACRWDIVTNVPVSSKRRRERGFDQSQRLAKETARNLHIPYEPLLVKHRDTRPQHTLSEEERRINLKGAYSLKWRKSAAEKKILLIDDVVTTGSTLLECASVLLNAGASSVECAALASAEKCIPDIAE
ncbi:MAG: ComF family protein [Hydrogeniiclostridium sp.]